MNKAVPLMIQGTHSDAGKSVLATAFCRLFAQMGYKTAPFKSQNMALNSYITLDSKEIGRAQGVQAEAAGVIATTDMNPILIKPSRKNEAQIVIHGEPSQQMEGFRYREAFFEQGLQIIKESYARLSQQYERIVIEGAGSPAEINLNDRELVNMRVARLTNAPVILVGDIEKGGVFASLVGTLQLLEPEDRERVIGVIINKFHGDVSLLQPGLTWFEDYTQKPVLGVIPHIPDLHIEAEDSVSLNQYTSTGDTTKEIDIAVIRYPMISNFTDMDPFFIEPDCHVRYVSRVQELGNPDLIILPGSKNTMEDLQFLYDSGLADRIKSFYQHKQAILFGICGGYQMLGHRIEDPFGVESPQKVIDGLGFLPLHTTMTKVKKTVLSSGKITCGTKTLSVTGYEIHMGASEFYGEAKPFIQMDHNSRDGSRSVDDQVIGTYFHGIFHNDEFRKHLINELRRNKALPPINHRDSFQAYREDSFDRLARAVQEHTHFELIHQKMKEYQS